MKGRGAIAAAALLALGGCDLAPPYVRPLPPVPALWPEGAAYDPVHAEAPQLSWRQAIGDARLAALISRALEDNRALRATVAEVASAHAGYRGVRSAEAPTLTGSATTGGGGVSGDGHAVSAGVSGFELDLFARLRNQSRAAFETYLATEAGGRTARIMLTAEVATAYVALAANHELLNLARETAANGERSRALTRSLLDAGLTNAAAVADAETVVAQAQADIERYTTLVAQGRNALDLLVGSPVGGALLPPGLGGLDQAIGAIPAGLSSAILLRRPDIAQAEHRLKGTHASIGAARAAFFPILTLTSAAGFAGSALSSLLGGGPDRSWAANATEPVLGGQNRANVAYARSQRDYNLALYEQTVRGAFREVSDILARRGTIRRQRDAQDRLIEAADRSLRLAEAQYRAGTSGFLGVLVAQRALYAARQAEIAAIVDDIASRIALCRALAADVTS